MEHTTPDEFGLPDNRPSVDEIGPSTVLPAVRTAIDLETADGLHLVGELAVPVDRPPVATLVLLHPLPTNGGSSDSHVYRKAAARLPALAGLAVLRFNTRGTTSTLGTSEGRFDEARDERFDVAAAIEYAEFHGLPHIWLVGWSFGSDLVLMHGCDPAIDGAIVLSPALRFTQPDHLTTWATSEKPLVALVPEFDDYLRPAEAHERFAAVPQAEIVAVDGAKHLWVGETYVRRVLNEIVARANPSAVPLPTRWSAA